MEKVKKKKPTKYEQNTHIYKETENLKRNQKKNSEAKKYYNKKKKLTREIQRQISTDRRINKFEDRTV